MRVEWECGAEEGRERSGDACARNCYKYRGRPLPKRTQKKLERSRRVSPCCEVLIARVMGLRRNWKGVAASTLAKKY